MDETEPRYCRHDGVILVRHPDETKQHWIGRKYCNRTCADSAKMMPVPQELIDLLARGVRGLDCLVDQLNASSAKPLRAQKWSRHTLSPLLRRLGTHKQVTKDLKEWWKQSTGWPADLQFQAEDPGDARKGRLPQRPETSSYISCASDLCETDTPCIVRNTKR